MVSSTPSEVSDGAEMSIRDDGDYSCVVALYCVGVLSVLAQGIILGYVVRVETPVYWVVVFVVTAVLTSVPFSVMVQLLA